MHQLGELESTEASIKPIRMNLKHSKVGRNDPCPCGSGLKYKKCCAAKADAAPPSDLAEVYARKHRIRVKTPADIEAIRRAGRLVVATLDLVAPRLRPGPLQRGDATLEPRHHVREIREPCLQERRVGHPAFSPARPR